MLNNNISAIRIEGVDVSSGSAPEDWNQTISRLGGSIFHSTYWASYEANIQGCTPVFLLARDQYNEPCAAAMAMYFQSSNILLSLVNRYMELPAHPCCGDSDHVIQDFVRKCEEYARRRGCTRLSIGSNMSTHSPLIPAQLGYTEHHRSEFLVNLTQETEVLWGAMRKDQRQRINRLEKDGIVISEGRQLEDLKGLKMARESTQERRSNKNQGYELRKEEEFYSRIYEYLIKPGVARLFIARKDQEVVAAILFAAFNKQAYSVFSGSTSFGYKAGAQSGLYWRAVETFKDEGYRLLNRGGVPAAAESEDHELHGIYRFKQRLGTIPTLCRSGEKVLSPVRESLNKLKDRIGAMVRGS